ncbi:MAG: hypothetical protein L0Y56_13675 [Nitrospira sp.]|nr:hypothetical protein [Nitrospira sp.]
MATPLIMLFLMTAPYGAMRLLVVMTHRKYDFRAAGAIGLVLLFTFTGIGHFIQTDPMAQMLPPWVPARVLIIYLTGILEFALAVGFAIPKFRRLTGWVAAVILILFFPANIYAAFNHVPMGGHAWGLIYLLIRAPLQVFILFWVYWFCIKPPSIHLYRV